MHHNTPNIPRRSTFQDGLTKRYFRQKRPLASVCLNVFGAEIRRSFFDKLDFKSAYRLLLLPTEEKNSHRQFIYICTERLEKRETKWLYLTHEWLFVCVNACVCMSFKWGEVWVGVCVCASTVCISIWPCQILMDRLTSI